MLDLARSGGGLKPAVGVERQGLRVAPVALICVSFACLLAAWLMATPPFGAPDEQSHYLRALTITHGKLLGPKVAQRRSAAQAREPNWLREQQAWAAKDTRSLYVSAKLSPPGVACLDGAPNVRGCQEATPNGDYPPLAYLLPAVALQSAAGANAGDRLGRVASALPVLGFLALAVVLISALGSWAVVGLLLAVTPMVLFVGSVLNSSGLAIAASLACAAAALRIVSDPERPQRDVWAALALSGAVTILSWQLGPWFVILALVLAAGMGGPGLLRAARSRRAALVGAILIGALLLAVTYGVNSGVFHGQLTLTPIGGRVKGGISQLFQWVLPDSVGDFGWQTVRLPTASYWVWWLGTGALIAGALKVGRPRMRAVVLFALFVAIAFPVLFFAFIYSNAGFGMQGRQVLPLLMLVPLVAGATIQRRSDVRPFARPAVLPIAIVAIAGFQLFAWWINASHSAGAPENLSFFTRASWSPPAGWEPWIALALLGTICMAASAFLTVPSRFRRT